MNQETFIIRRTYDAPVQKVWQAITDKKQMNHWYFDNLETFKPEVGFATSFNVHHNGKDYLHIWKVTEVIPGKKISYEWKYGGYPGNSVVSFELFEEEGNKTTLTVTHTGLETFKPDTYPELAKEQFAQGWTSFIGKSLKKYVENMDAVNA